MAELIVYGCSDDLLEFEGVIREEYDISRPTRFLITARRGPGSARQAILHADYGTQGWELLIGTASDFPDDWVVRTARRPDRDDDPALRVHIDDDEKVMIRKLGEDD